MSGVQYGSVSQKSSLLTDDSDAEVSWWRYAVIKTPVFVAVRLL